MAGAVFLVLLIIGIFFHTPVYHLVIAGGAVRRLGWMSDEPSSHKCIGCGAPNPWPVRLCCATIVADCFSGLVGSHVASCFVCSRRQVSRGPGWALNTVVFHDFMTTFG